MALRKPTAQDKIAFFTRRILGEKGKAMIWRFADEAEFNIEYTCPHCGKPGEKRMLLERKKVSITNPTTGKRKSKKAYLIPCESCKQDIVIEQWAKAGPGKKKAA